MWAWRSNNGLFALFLCATQVCAQSEQVGRSVRHHTVATPDSATSALLDQAETLLAKGDYTAAQPLLQQATVKDPQSYQAWYDLGYAEQALNHNAEAIAAYRRSVEINPKIFESNLNLGIALAAAGQQKDAIDYLTKATEIQPTAHPEQAKEHAYLTLGRLQTSADPAAAEKALIEAAKLVPADPQPHLLLADLD